MHICSHAHTHTPRKRHTHDHDNNRCHATHTVAHSPGIQSLQLCDATYAKNASSSASFSLNVGCCAMGDTNACTGDRDRDRDAPPPPPPEGDTRRWCGDRDGDRAWDGERERERERERDEGDRAEGDREKRCDGEEVPRLSRLALLLPSGSSAGEDCVTMGGGDNPRPLFTPAAAP